ncbi:hypothetical protein ACWAUA_004196, partial [Enterobacter roggenkampii]
LMHSNEKITLFSSIESCPLIDWGSYSRAKCRNWKINEISSPGKAVATKKEIDDIFKEFNSFILNYLKSKGSSAESVS